MMWLVTAENEDDGIWYDDPNGFDTKDQALEWAKSQPSLPDGNVFVLWRCEPVGPVDVGRLVPPHGSGPDNQ